MHACVAAGVVLEWLMDTLLDGRKMRAKLSTCTFAGPQNACQSLHVGTLMRVDTRTRA